MFLHGHRDFCLGKHLVNMVQVNELLEQTLKKSMEEAIPASGCKFQCFVCLGKVAWFINEEVLQHHNQHYPLTLESFSQQFQKIKLPHIKSSGLKEQFYQRFLISKCTVSIKVTILNTSLFYNTQCNHR